MSEAVASTSGVEQASASAAAGRRGEPVGPVRDSMLDGGRALAAFVMVVGHTFDATLSLTARTTPEVEQYWRYRGVTAPLFLCVSGWAVLSAMTRGGAAAPFWDRWPRALLLLGTGYLLRLPTWGIDQLLAGDETVWRHTLGFDALHLVGLCLFLSGPLVAWLGATWRLAVVAGAAAAAIAVSSAWVWERLWHAPMAVSMVWGHGSSPFAFFPWSAFFLLGVALGASLGRVHGVRRALVLGALGTAGVVWGRAAGLDELGVVHVAQMAWRVGHALLLLALASVVPAAWTRLGAPVAKRSLAIYVIHLPVVYGWGSTEGLATRVGATLSPAASFGTGVALFAGSVAFAVAWDRVRPSVVAGGRRALAWALGAPRVVEAK